MKVYKGFLKKDNADFTEDEMKEVDELAQKEEYTAPIGALSDKEIETSINLFKDTNAAMNKLRSYNNAPKESVDLSGKSSDEIFKIVSATNDKIHQTTVDSLRGFADDIREDVSPADAFRAGVNFTLRETMTANYDLGRISAYLLSFIPKVTDTAKEQLISSAMQDGALSDSDKAVILIEALASTIQKEDTFDLDDILKKKSSSIPNIKNQADLEEFLTSLFGKSDNEEEKDIELGRQGQEAPSEIKEGQEG